MNPKIAEVTQRIIERSKETRKAYLEKIEEARRQGPHRGVLSCGNLAHGFAACGDEPWTQHSPLATGGPMGLPRAWCCCPGHQPLLYSRTLLA